ncbi:MAG: glycosyltransferase family 2 protein [Patescibacteria group bacterium]
MKVTVIIPTYNEEETINKCLESLCEQTYKKIEVIVVDDGSIDNTLSIVGDLRFKKYDLRIFEQKHKGPGEARNLGATHAKGEILVFVDADMTFERDFIEKLVAPIIRGNASGTWSREEYVSNWENVWALCWNINEGWEERKLHPKNYPPTQKVFRALLKSEFDKVGGFELGGYYTDDWSLSQKLGYEAVAAPDAKFYHANPSNLSEVFNHAHWVAKREYKLGILGATFALFRASLPVSLVVGLVKSILNKTPHFLIFKIVYDFGIFIGILEYRMTGRGAK